MLFAEGLSLYILIINSALALLINLQCFTIIEVVELMLIPLKFVGILGGQRNPYCGDT